MKLAASFIQPVVFSICSLCLWAALPIRAATIAWTNTAGGNWGLALNWNPHQVPGPGDVARVTLTTASKVEIKLDTDATVAGVLMNGSAHAVKVNGHTFTINGPVEMDSRQEIDLDSGTLAGSAPSKVSGGTILWTGGSLSGPWSLDSTNLLRLQGVTGGVYDLRGALTNAGTIQVVSGNLRFRDAQIYNLSGGLVDFQSDSDIANYSTGSELLGNQGIIRKSGGTGISIVDVPVQNRGAVEVLQGTLDWSGGGSIEPGSTFTGSGTNQFSGDSFTISTSINVPNARLAGATLVGENAVLHGSWVWTSGSLGQQGSTFTLSSAGVLALRGTAGSLYDMLGAFTNAGTLQVVSGNLRCRDGQIYNLPGGLIDFQSDSDIANYSIGTELLSNAGTVRKSGGTGLSTVDVAWRNGGAVDVQKGTLDWSEGGSIEPGSTFTGTGTNLFSGGTFSVATTAGIPNARLAGAALVGVDGVGILSGSWVWTSGSLGQQDNALTLASPGVLKLKGTTGSVYDLLGALTNAGTIQIVSGSLRCRDGQIYNLPGALIDFQSDSDVASYSIGTEALSNKGIVRKSGGSGTSSVDVPFINTGTVDVLMGTLSFSEGGSLGPGSGFTGTGTNEFSGGTFVISAAVEVPRGRLAGALFSGVNGALGGSWVWSSGYLGQPGGILTLSHACILMLQGNQGSPYDLQGIITNLGTIYLSRGNLRLRDGQLYNLPGGMVDFQGDSSIDSYSSGSELLSNEGVLRKSGGTGTSVMDVALFNSGTVDIRSGTVAFNNGGIFGAGTTFLNGGTNKFSGGTFTLNTSMDVGNALLAGARLVGVDSKLSGSWVWTSGYLGQPGSRLKLAVDAELLLKGITGSPYDMEGIVTNLGTVRLISGNLRLRDGQFYNQVSGLVEFQSDSDVASFFIGAELLFNYGTLRKSGGTGTSSVDVPLKNHGTLDVQTGKVSLEDEHDLTGGRINCGINGPASNGQVNLSGSALLLGTFSANLNNGYQPNVGDTVNVVTYGSRTGLFSSAALPSAYTWETNYSATVFSLKVAGNAVISGLKVRIDFLGGAPHLTWDSQVGERFQPQYRDDLASGTWNNLGPILVATRNMSEATDSTAQAVLARFYRVQKVP